MSSKYLLQVFDTELGEVVNSWAPGMAAEKLLIEEFAARLDGKNIGLFRTAAQSKTAAIEALCELIKDLKRQV